MFDPRWLDAAREWLQDAELPADVVKRYEEQFAQILQDQAEQFLEYDVVEGERERDEAAKDAHDHRRIDEARGK